MGKGLRRTGGAGLWQIACLAVALCAACAGQESGGGGGTVAGDSSPSPDLGADVSDAHPGVDATGGPPCKSDDDCAGVYVGLSICEAARCEANHFCARVAVESGTPCDDGDACTGGEACLAGTCAGGNALHCDDGNPCTVEGCDPASGCTHSPVPGPCPDDGNPCTSDESCIAGTCSGAYHEDVPGCVCTRDADCPVPASACLGAMSCSGGRCALVPAGGVTCDTALTGPCMAAACDSSTGACVLSPTDAPCDDGNPCTPADTCHDGTCVGDGAANTCPCASDEDCAAFDDQDACNGTLTCGGGLCVVDVATVIGCAPEPEGSCLRSRCQPATGLCKLDPVADGVACTDGSACTLGDVCQAGVCVGSATALCGPPTDCGGVPCASACWSVPACDPDLGCQVGMADGGCDDGLGCTTGDVCLGGVCHQGALAADCDDGVACTLDSCVDPGGCVHQPDDSACPGKGCTIDVCQPGTGCVHDVDPAKACCADDKNDCTTELCLSDCSCFQFNNVLGCDDLDACTAGDTCQGGVCRPGDKICPCNEDANCTPPGGGVCDGVWHCIANQCVLETAAASGCDAAPGTCTKTWCEPASGSCKQAPLPDGSPCSDGSACTVGEGCQAGVCGGGLALECNDGNPCTNDSCAASTGCKHAPNAAPCDDDDACTVNDTCKAGACTSAKSVCACKADDDCAKPANLCNGHERCIANACQLDPSTVVACGSPGPCLVATCVPQTGQCLIQKKADDAPCSDGDACTSGETCHAGSCLGGTLMACDDGSVCTHDACDPKVGCVFEPAEGPCNDADPCTGDESCSQGTCTALSSLCAEVCGNGLDDDGNATIDCADPACAKEPGCDGCASAPWLPCGTAQLSGSVGPKSASDVGTTGCGPGPYAERIYRFTTTEGGPVTLQILDGADAFTLRVLTAGDGGGCDLGSCVAAGPLLTFTAAPGKVYHVVVEALSSSGGAAFTLAATCALPCVPACAGGCGPDGCGGLCGASCEDADPCTADACIGGECASVPLPGCCTDSSECAGGGACTVATCTGMKCVYGHKPGCCESAADCEDGNACTTNGCVLGKCVESPAPGCCTADADCGGAGPCETSLCALGTCLVIKQVGCCTTAADCTALAGVCDAAQCVKGQCVTQPIPGCCDSAADCDDGDACTYDACDAALEVCVHVSAPGCCAVADDCPDDGDPCTLAVCKSGGCTQTQAPDCCDSDTDCAAEGPCESSACVESKCVASAVAGCCSKDAECDDGNACTSDACSASQCVHGAIAGCCKTPSDCGDGDPCTSDGCKDGKCAYKSVPGCCASDSDCLDTDACTKDTCVGGTCAHADVPKCCKSPTDCKPGPCLLASCTAGQCSYVAEPGACCTKDSDCTPLGPSCTKGQCAQGTCKLSIAADCCVTDKDCTPKGPCQRASCSPGAATGTCKDESIAGCCASDADCAGADYPCQKARCLGHACVSELIPGCCQDTGDCAPDVEPCTITACSAPESSCQTIVDPNCCGSDADCPPTPLGACKLNVCVLGTCATKDVPGCCQDDDACAAAASSPCEAMGCLLGQCVAVGHKPGCCTSATQCPPTPEPCARTECIDNACKAVPVSGCCTSASDCPSPVKPCRKATCDRGACGVAKTPGCCVAAADCPDDGNACTTGSCQAGECVSSTVAGCCLADGDCPPAGACTLARCVGHACVTSPAPGCCLSTADCPDGGDPCHVPVCQAGACLSVPLTGCCAGDLDCPEDADPCTAASCSGGTCTWTHATGCCDESADCPASGDPCAPPICVAGRCAEEIMPGCALGACTFSGWDGPTPGWVTPLNPAGLGWAPSADDAFTGPGALHAAFAKGTALADIETSSPRVTIDGGARLRFRYKLSVATGDCQAGRLAVRVHIYGVSANLPVWETCLPSGDWKAATVDLASFSGQSIDVVFVLSSGAALAGGSAWIDDVAISGACRLECKGPGCDDGNACTTSTCEGGYCKQAAVPGCCETDLACADDDPCTTDACGAGGACQHVLVPGCAAGACLAESFSSAIPQGWQVTSTSPAFVFAPSTADPLGGGAHASALAGPISSLQTSSLALPPLHVAKEAPALRFALRQDVGPTCELGRLVVVVEGVDHPVPCGTHPWQAVAVALPGAAGGVIHVSFRAEAKAPGARIDLDDVRIGGACHVLGCEQPSDCGDEAPCAVVACDASFQCAPIGVPGCCESDADCPAPTAPCRVAACEAGACVAHDAPGCGAGACWFEPFGGGPPIDWQLDESVWSSSGFAFSSPSALYGLAPPSKKGVARLPPLMVGSGLTRLRLQYLLSVAAADPTCASGSLELWVGSDLLWHDCDGQDGFAPVEVSLGAYVGRVVRPELRLRSSAAGGANAVVDDVRVTGACAKVQCATAFDCDDENPCTVDACLGYACLHATNQLPCDDGDACTVGDTCSGGLCQAQPLVCYDDEPCTLDGCDPAVGCQFLPAAGVCDDGDPCTAGDACDGGTCAGTGILCKDFNPCTRDGCTPGVGCEFAPEPFGTPCEGGGSKMCWDSACVEWERTLSEPEGTATNTRGYAVSERASAVPIFVAGTSDPEGVARATLFRIDAQSLGLKVVADSKAASAWYALHESLAVGADGSIVSTTPDLDPPALDVPKGLDLHAVTSAASTWFLGGDGSAFGAVQSTLRRCKLSPAGWTCHRMPVVHSPGQCGKQIPFHVRALWAVTPQKVLVAGMSVQGGNQVARVAVWDGNTFDDCPGLGVYSGEAYYADPDNALTLAVDAAGAGVPECFRTLGGSGSSTLWAAGTRGLLYRFDGATWAAIDPAQWAATSHWNAHHDVHALYATATEVHFVGDGVGIRSGGCRDGFYLHGTLVGGTWVFDRLLHFGDQLMDCGTAPFDHVGLRDITLDHLTGDVYVVGWGPDGPALKERKGLVMRLEKP